MGPGCGRCHLHVVVHAGHSHGEESHHRRHPKSEAASHAKAPASAGTAPPHSHSQHASHSHGGAGGAHAHAHHHHDGHSHMHLPPGASNWLYRALHALFRRTGLLHLAEAWHDSAAVCAAAAALFSVAALASYLGSAQLLAASVAQPVSTAATAAVFVLAGLPQVVDMCLSLSAGHVDTHVLMTLAVLGTLVIGAALEGALLLVLFAGSHAVEHLLTDRAAGDLRALLDSAPAHADLVPLRPDGAPDLAAARRVAAAEVPVGAHMVVRPGEQVPLDGCVVYGEALVSSEHITGEALPSRVRPGQEVPAGSRNHDGVLVLRAMRLSADSTPARIARLTADAQAKRPQLRRWLDAFGEAYARAVIAATLAALVVLPLAGVPLLGGGAAGGRGAVYRAMGLLTTASPCALVLVPLAYVSAIAAASSRGILVRGGRVLDALAQCSAVAFDKTGTLTMGTLAATAMLPLSLAGTDRSLRQQSSDHPDRWPREVAASGRADDAAALAAAVALSLRASHPVSRAMAAAGRAAGPSLATPDVADFRLEPGAGVSGTIQRRGKARHVRFGSAEYAAQGLPPREAAALEAAAAAEARHGVVSVLLEEPLEASGSSHSSSSGSSSSTSNGARPAEDDDRLIRLFTFNDTVHQRSAEAVAALQSGSWRGAGGGIRQAFRVLMLTGDNAVSAQRIAGQLGISDVRAGLTPEEKLQEVHNTRSLQEAGKLTANRPGVIMVGDGINDAPALAAADVGMALAATPSEAAAAAADVILLNSDGVSALPELLALAAATRAVVAQNLGLALGSIAALALPTLAGWIPLWLAVALHEGSTLAVALNSLRLLRFRKAAPRAAVGGARGAQHAGQGKGAGAEIQLPGGAGGEGGGQTIVLAPQTA